MTQNSDKAFDAALAALGVTPDPHDRAAALRIAIFLRECRERLLDLPETKSEPGPKA